MRDLIEKLSQVMPILLIIFVFYFFVMRPQQKKAKELQEMVSKLKRGDTVITSGGLMGVVDRLVDETYIALRVSEGVVVTVLRDSIADIVKEVPPIKLDVPEKASKESAPKKKAAPATKKGK